MDFATLRAVPRLRTSFGDGFGMAACPALGILATCKYGAVSVFTLPDLRKPGPPALVAQVHMYISDSFSGCMAFMDPAEDHRLLVADYDHDAVQIIDVGARRRFGYIGTRGSIPGPRGVAARGSMVAVSCWKPVSFSDHINFSDHIVRLFEGSGSAWVALRTMGGGVGGPGGGDGQLRWPYGLRLTSDGSGVAVADWGNGRVSQFRVGDGSFVRHLATGLSGPLDVEECEGGWLAACWGSDTVEFVGGDGVGQVIVGKPGSGDGEIDCPTDLALVRGLGLLVREGGSDARLQVFATSDAIAMAGMSAARVAWMSLCSRLTVAK
jgi:hypothetical protein